MDSLMGLDLRVGLARRHDGDHFPPVLITELHEPEPGVLLWEPGGLPLSPTLEVTLAIPVGPVGTYGAGAGGASRARRSLKIEHGTSSSHSS